MELMQALKGRRSVRKYKPDPVTDAQIHGILEAGRWAPSWANSQCFRFIVVRDGELKAKVADARGHNNPAGDAIRNAPLIIVICGELGKSGYYKGSASTDKGDWYMFDTALAAQNMMLAAHGMGLATVPVGLFDAPQVAGMLDVPSNVQVVLILPIGYPDEEVKAPPRKEIAEITFYEKYGRKGT